MKNREIKFRVWCSGRNEWEKDELFLTKDGRLVNPLIRFNHRNETQPISFYTGLKDINSKEIYEGDILAWRGNDVSDNSRLSKVVYKGSSFYVVGINWMANWWLEEQNNSYEIIGNIFENPELLK